jgi:putative flavoprotein involved in K+ transport
VARRDPARDVHPAIVVGAGPAGLASAAMLGRASVPSLVLEAGDAVGRSWRDRYDRLHLNTSRWFARLPGERHALDAGVFPSRDDFVAHLERCVASERLQVRLRTAVQRVERADAGWRLATRTGDFLARNVVIATGYDRVAHMPMWPGRHGFTGELLHASAYRAPDPYAEKDVLVVGPGCTGTEVALDLAQHGARRVWLAVRTPPHIVLRSSGGVPSDALAIATRRIPQRAVDALAKRMCRLSVGDLAAHGLPCPEEGIGSRFARTGISPSVVDKQFITAVREGDIRVVAAVDRFECGDVVLGCGGRLTPDVVVAATGYRRGLEGLVGHLGVLDDDGAPQARGGERHPAAPGLYFVGYRNVLTGIIREARLDARAVARAVRCDEGDRAAA